MSDKFFPDISVGDFAMDILKSMKNDPMALKPALKESTIQSSNAPDISRITVSDDYVSLVTEGKKIKPTKKIIKESKEDRLANLVERLNDLVGEARLLVEEMTSTGNIGVGFSNNKASKKSKLIRRLRLR